MPNHRECDLIFAMTMKISEEEFARICTGICEDRDVIIEHNPIGTDSEILLWMLLSCLNSYLSLDATEMPCFTSRPDKQTYHDAILFVLRNRKLDDFDTEKYLLNLK